MLQRKEFHVIEYDEQMYFYLPEYKICFKLNQETGESLKKYEQGQKMDSISQKFFQEVAESLANEKPLQKKFRNNLESITLILANDCNLRCKYCYLHQGTYEKDRQLMSVETARTAIDKLFSISDRIRNIRFFGGEPTLNFPVLKEVCHYLTDVKGIKDMRYNLETNGTIMNEEMLHTLKKYDVNISISLDGNQECHDKNRLYNNGRGSFQDVLHTMESLKRNDILFGLQCTYNETHQNMTIEELIEDLTTHSSYFKIAPCITDTYEKKIDHNDLTLQPIKYLLQEHPIYHTPTIQDLSAVLAGYHRLEFCEALCQLSIFPDGSVYPCELFYQNQTYYAGNVHDADFPGTDFQRVMEIMQRFNRDELLGDYWFRYLINPICIGKVLAPDLDPNQTIHYDKETEKKYESLVGEVMKILSSEQRDLFMKNFKAFQFKG